MDPQQLIMMLLQGMGNQQGGVGNLFGNRAPMFGSSPIMPSQIFDLGALGFNPSSPAGMSVGMLMQGMLPQLMGPNFIPGQFSPTQNLFDHRYAVNYFLQRQQAMRTASQADSETYFRMLRGFARMRGIEWQSGSAQEQAGTRLAQDISTLTPFLAQIAPDFVDQLSGVRGSATLLAGNIFEAGRFSVDPVSGRFGMTGESAGAISREVFNTLYGPGADLSRMRGISAGAAGRLYEDINRRGFGAPAFLTRQESIRGLQQELAQAPDQIRSPELRRLRASIDANDQGGQDAFNRIGAALERMNQQANSPALENALRSFNAVRIARTVENMSGAVSAMRDIFGDMGRPNAPMVELINGLQAMTQGGLAHMTPQQLEMSVRQTYNIARMTGLGLEGIQGFAGTAAQTLERLGTSRLLAPQIAQSAAAFGFSWGINQQPTQFGAIDRENAAQMAIRLQSQAAVSPQATRLAALMQFSEQFVQPNGQVGFAGNTEAAAIANAIRAGQTTYNFGGQNRSIFQSSAGMMQILQAAGVNSTEAQLAVFAPPRAAAAMVERFNLAPLVAQGQAELDILPMLSRVFTGAAGSSLQGIAGVPLEQRADLADAIGRAMSSAARDLMTSDPTMFNRGREAARNRAIATRIRGMLGDRLRNITDAQLDNMVAAAFLRADIFIATPGSPFAGYQSTTGLLQFTNPRNFTASRQLQAEAAAVSSLQSALSSIGQEGILARISDFAQNLRPGQSGTIQDLLRTGLGGIPIDSAAFPLQALLNRVVGLQNEFNQAGTNFANDPERMRAVQARIVEDIRRLAPDISAVLQNEMNRVTPAGMQVINAARTQRLQQTAAPVGQIGANVANLLAPGGMGGIGMLGMMNLQPPPAAGLPAGGMPGTPGLITGPPQAGAAPAAGNVALNTGTVTFGEVENITITGRNIRIGLNELILNPSSDIRPSSGAIASGTGGLEGAIRPQQLVGTLTLEGLDRVLFTGTTVPMDSRGQIA